jgi:S1-C subfamily serine protease
MRTRQVVIVAAILVGLVVTIVASLVAGVERCTAPTDECVRTMVARLRGQGWLGLETERLHGTTTTVVAVAPGSPADTAGFMVGDALMALDGSALGDGDSHALATAGALLRPGALVTCTVARRGVTVTLQARLTAPPDDWVAREVGKHVMTEHARVTLLGR